MILLGQHTELVARQISAQMGVYHDEPRAIDCLRVLARNFGREFGSFSSDFDLDCFLEACRAK